MPIYAISCAFSVQFPANSIYFDLFRDCYEAFVIYCFLSLVIAKVGGDANCIRQIGQNPGSINHPFPFCMLPSIPLQGRFLRTCKQGTLQFVVVKIVVVLVSLVMIAMNLNDDPGFVLILKIVYNVSYSLALYMLVLFLFATKNILRDFSPVKKFFAVKTVVFLTYWQSLLIAPISGESPQLTNSFVLLFEMVFFALLHWQAFNYSEFSSHVDSSTIAVGIGQILSVKDIIRDTYHNFVPTYQDYMIQSQHEEEFSPARAAYRAKTFLIGNLDSYGQCGVSGLREDSDSETEHDGEVLIPKGIDNSSETAVEVLDSASWSDAEDEVEDRTGSQCEGLFRDVCEGPSFTEEHVAVRSIAISTIPLGNLNPPQLLLTLPRTRRRQSQD